MTDEQARAHEGAATPDGSAPQDGTARPGVARRAGALGRVLASRSTAGRAAVAAVLVLAGGLFATSARTAEGSDLRDDTSSLSGLVVEEQHEIAARGERLAELREEVDGLTAAVQDPAVVRLQERTAQVALAAGTVAVSGPGLEVTLDDAPQNRPQPEGVGTEDLIVHQEDLQGVVNALWAGGAEAIVLEDQRLITTSAVRCVGNTLKLQGRLYAPPYTVRAVGDPARLQAALDASEPVQIYRQYAQVYGLGWDLAARDVIDAPAWTGTVETRYAEPVETAAAPA
jgi:uncharacterized protein YlxW (UPF0749 family)